VGGGGGGGVWITWRLNNDGFEDIFVKCWPRNFLYRNNGDGTFYAILPGRRITWNAKAVEFWMYLRGTNRNGLLDLFVAHAYSGSIPRVIPRAGTDSEL